MKTPKRLRVWLAIAALIAAVTLGAFEASRQVQLRLGMTLHEAAANGDDGELQRLLRLRADVYATDDAGDTALHLAAQNLQADAVRMLLEKHAEVDAKDAAGLTPLQRCMKMNGPLLEVVRLLLEHGADPTVKAESGRPLPSIAARKNRSELAELLLVHGARFDERGALDWGHAETFASLAEHDALFATQKHADGKTLLEIYMDRNAEGLVTALLPFVDPNLKNEAGEPLLIQFLREDKTQWIRILVDFGADLSAQDREGLTPLHFVVRDGHNELADLFMQHDSDLNARDTAGFTPLHYAAQNGDASAARVLLGVGADPNLRSEEDLTPLGLVRELLNWIETQARVPSPVRRMQTEKYRAVEEILLAHGATP